jgi:hypothetical protein
MEEEELQMALALSIKDKAAPAAAAALPRVPAEAGAMEEVDGHWESLGTEVVAVVAGTGAEFGA